MIIEKGLQIQLGCNFHWTTLQLQQNIYPYMLLFGFAVLQYILLKAIFREMQMFVGHRNNTLLFMKWSKHGLFVLFCCCFLFLCFVLFVFCFCFCFFCRCNNSTSSDCKLLNLYKFHNYPCLNNHRTRPPWHIPIPIWKAMCSYTRHGPS